VTSVRIGWGALLRLRFDVTFQLREHPHTILTELPYGQGFCQLQHAGDLDREIEPANDPCGASMRAVNCRCAVDFRTHLINRRRVRCKRFRLLQGARRKNIRMDLIWADQSLGRFRGWDPKENGALLIVLWNAMSFTPAGVASSANAGWQ
jgi:hypothetical protein